MGSARIPLYRMMWVTNPVASSSRVLCASPKGAETLSRLNEFLTDPESVPGQQAVVRRDRISIIGSNTKSQSTCPMGISCSVGSCQVHTSRKSQKKL